MRKEKAIEKLSAECNKCTALSDPELKDALHIGIEAIYMCKRAKEFNWPHWPKFLKGETELDTKPQSFVDRRGRITDGWNGPPLSSLDK